MSLSTAHSDFDGGGVDIIVQGVFFFFPYFKLKYNF